MSSAYMALLETLVLCVDEKSVSRPWIYPRRACRTLPIDPARTTHDYVRDGTSLSCSPRLPRAPVK